MSDITDTVNKLTELSHSVLAFDEVPEDAIETLANGIISMERHLNSIYSGIEEFREALQADHEWANSPVTDKPLKTLFDKVPDDYENGS